MDERYNGQRESWHEWGKKKKALNTWLRQVRPSTGGPEAHVVCQKGVGGCLTGIKRTKR